MKKKREPEADARDMDLEILPLVKDISIREDSKWRMWERGKKTSRLERSEVCQQTKVRSLLFLCLIW